MAVYPNARYASTYRGRHFGPRFGLDVIARDDTSRMSVHQLSATTSIPEGYGRPAVVLPRVSGALSAKLIGIGAAGGAGMLALDALATLAGSGGITDAAGGLIVNLLATLAGSGGIVDADIKAFLNMAATIGGGGGVTASTLVGLGALDALLTGQGGASGSASGIGELEATLRGYGDLTPEGIRDAVWRALATDFLAPGTMGAKVNAASSAGDPWGATLPGSYPPGSAGAILGTYLADVWRRLGLGETQTTTKAGNVTTITDGTLVLTITENADGSVTVQRS